MNNADFIIPVEIDGTVHQVMFTSALCGSFSLSLSLSSGAFQAFSGDDRDTMGLGLIQVIQDRFVQISVAYSGRLGSGTLPAATDATGNWKK